MTVDEITDSLLKEIALITRNRKEDLSGDASLAACGINSMGFIELLLAVQRLWKVDLTSAGVTASDVGSVRALAEKIIAEMN